MGQSDRRDARGLVRQAAASTIGSLFRARSALMPGRIALDDGRREVRYAELNERANQAAAVLAGLGVVRGDRVALLSENRIEYFELELAAAKLGAILACQNWRLAPPELCHCIDLVEPKVVITSPRHRDLLAAAGIADGPINLELGTEFEARMADADPAEPIIAAEPEDGLFILYTSGTTGLPKGAVLSHRAEIARFVVLRADFGLAPDDPCVGWMPLFHMGGTEPALAALLSGGKVFVVDGFDPARLAEIIATERLGWLVLMPGMIEPLIAEIKRRDVKPKGVKLCGVMPDLVPAHQIAELTRLLDAPYANTFGATETGTPPCSSATIPVGEVPTRLSKWPSSCCEIRLVDRDGRDVPEGEPGELAMRGPTLFSGYWRAEATNLEDFRDGWFHMGDMFRRNPDGSLDFVDRVKYMIKSGGENIYPAEIERVLLADPRVADAVVVKCKDAKWGEVPVAFVAPDDDRLTASDLHALCRQHLAGYKQPKEIR
ncbi:MAG: AMP-binding protein, partial [Proteobacteria bacterium]|nr:AMP-binding protein [Pseudomonadota bacterium]